MAHNVLDVANAIVRLSNPEVGDIISNLKLQKLLYYVQGFSLVLLGGPMFDENIKAWEYGPVVEEAYRAFRCNGSGAIMPDPDFNASSKFSKQELDLIIEVYDVYGQFSALRLMQMTHEESPWKTTGKDQIISHDKLVCYFKNQIE